MHAAVEQQWQGGVSEGLGEAGHLPQPQGQPGEGTPGLLRCLICPLAFPTLAEGGFQTRQPEPQME